MSPDPVLARKLGLRPGLRACLLPGPTRPRQAIRQSGGSGVRWASRLGTTPCDLIFFWPDSLKGLEAEFARLQRHLKPDGAIWAILPKKAYAAERGISFSWGEMQARGLRGDLVDNKIASIDPTDYGTRFVIRRDRR